jgi:TPR repeat protein
LGKIYEEGLLVPIDIKKALAYYQKAINDKDVYANYRYAICLMKGKVNNGEQTK